MDASAQMKKMIPQINRQIWNIILGKKLGVPDDLQTEIREEMTRQMQAMVPQSIELLIPVYRRNLTPLEVKAAIEFYSSPAGKSLAKKLAKMTVEGFQVGAQFGRQMSKRAVQTAIKRLREKGYQL